MMTRQPAVRERRPVTEAERQMLSQSVIYAELMAIRVVAEMEAIW